MNAQKLPAEEIEKALKKLNAWKLKKEGIEKNFSFKDFGEAFAFLSRVAILSEKLNHHAEWNAVYNKVNLRLSTHDVGGITKKDIDMAKAIDGVVGA